MRKNTILQYGPNRFRGRGKVNELLSTLYSQGKIKAAKKEKLSLYRRWIPGFNEVKNTIDILACSN